MTADVIRRIYEVCTYTCKKTTRTHGQARAAGGDERTAAALAKTEELREELEKMKADNQYEKQAAEEVGFRRFCRVLSHLCACLVQKSVAAVRDTNLWGCLISGSILGFLSEATAAVL